MDQLVRTARCRQSKKQRKVVCTLFKEFRLLTVHVELRNEETLLTRSNWTALVGPFNFASQKQSSICCHCLDPLKLVARGHRQMKFWNKCSLSVSSLSLALQSKKLLVTS